MRPFASFPEPFSLRSIHYSSLLVALSGCIFSGFAGVQPMAAQELNAAVGVHHVSIATAQPMISLEPMTDQELAAQSLAKETKTANAPANYRDFGSVRAGETTTARALTLRFASAGKLTKIEATKDAAVEQGGSCVEGNVYAANATCTLMVRFTPQGPGHRLAKVVVTSSAGVNPLVVGIGGNGSAPAISFTPSIISTVSQTYVSGTGIISGAGNLAIDGGDGLYIADTGNKLVRYLGSSGTLQNIDFFFTVTDPQGIAVDSFAGVYITQSNPATLLFATEQGSATQYTSGSSSCAIGSQCSFSGAPFNGTGALAIDRNNYIFMSTGSDAYEMFYSGNSLDYIPLVDYYDYNESTPGTPSPIAIDGSENVYAYENYSGSCYISYNSLYNAETSNYTNEVNVAGGRSCGFSGDGGQGRNAVIGTNVGQMTFDVAGNFYFSDTSNQRVRRIDGATGVISTIAGNGTAGYGGDGGPATSATLNTPTGVTVDSQGQVYILSNSATTGTAQVVRKVGTVGALNLGTAAVGIPTAAQTVTLANTGNSNLDFTHVGFSSGNSSDFMMDVNTTSCNFTVPLASGRSCKIGFIFKPTATGVRSAVLSITDDTIAGINTIQLSGTGTTTATLTPSSLSFASTTVGSTSASQTVTLANTGSAALTISSIAFSGAAAYTDTTTCGTSVAVGASCTIAISFKPTAAGAQNGTLTVTDTAVGGRQTVSLTGTGVASAAKASISPTSLTFASTAVGSTSAAQTITLSNTGTAALGVTSIKLAGTNPGDYVLSQACGTSVAAGGSCKITISFKPTATGSRTGSVSIVVSTGTLTATLTGTATAAAKKAVLSPSLASFGMQAISSASTVKTLKISNTSGTAMKVSAWTWSGANASDFSETHTCGATLAAGASCTVSLTFRPTAVGARAASMTITTSTGAMVAAMTGAGIAAESQPHQTPILQPLYRGARPE